MTARSPAVKNLLLTGPSGVGKSTLLKKVGFGLRDRIVRGFYGDAIFSEGRRLGWRLDTFDGDGGVLIHLDIPTAQRLGPYGVDMNLLDRLVDSQLRLDPVVDVYLIDEIGIVGPWSEAFVHSVRKLLDSSRAVVAIVRFKRTEGFAEEVRNRGDVVIWDVTPDNRDELVGKVIEWVERTTSS